MARDRPRVLVTGAGGFVGGHLVPRLDNAGWDAVPAPRREIGPDTEWGDALADCTAVVHLAALAHERAEAAARAGDYEALRRVNALGTERLATEAARAGVRRFVFMSTIGVCGDETSGRPFTEESAAAPHSLYATSKLEAERLLARVAAETGLSVAVLRPTLVYGPGNRGNFLRLLEAVDRGWPLPFASVENRRSLTFVGNLASAVGAVLGRDDAEGKFVVCDGRPLSTAEIVRALAVGLGRPARLVALPPVALQLAAAVAGKRELARRLVGSLEADCGKLGRVLGWQPPFSPDQGLGETGRWFREAGRGRSSG